MSIDWDEWTNLDFEETLEGKTLSAISESDDELVFTTDNGNKYKLFHMQDCCESVTIEDIDGDLDDLIGTPLVMVEEVGSRSGDNFGGHETWTYYKLGTNKGSVTIRWYGASNGYYSESVDFCGVKTSE